ncbi:M1 family metallopeptidase [Haliscomenobacter hydrossis]|uniref:Aminopeptidase N n=1 Tax=Haliscomenobacter hydrossis (strain ATCC 27775 / DSM 1100 / LMG 10767 / O) TaxID=760192 RepID=F4L5K9_HALH1|nr:M1 family aminopeptidase [Haliscomenobacter hydrossis]AEE51844.1 Membrane alanyl aminopeptidase [Haliscomenobacter hydrossis DSM 1100]
MKKILWLLCITLIVGACSTQKPVTTKTEPAQELVAEVDMDTLDVTALEEEEEEEGEEVATTLSPYSPSAQRIHDLLHTKIDVRFDWAKEEVIGKATLKLKPYFNPTSTLTLDAKGMEFKKVQFAGKDQPLKYTYDGQQIVIQLGRSFNRNEEYSIDFEYIARPKGDGGSDAITSNQGLFFINPRGEEMDKPQQIWTQGETEWNSRWFPTIDKPNERCTQELYVTVDKKFKTLSNGLLTTSTNNADGTRTDYWKMDMPHAPYLFMLAVGDFAIVKDKWRNIEVSYYVEPEYEADARDIFAHTPEMLEFFSNKLGVNYPWPKFSQIVVRDYVSGAMENTTAVVFGDFVQKHKWELIDDSNDKIVAHEMFHHWFGDYVTSESWPNLTMNEGFANYSEYLWFEHKYGSDYADHHLYTEQGGYIGSASGGIHPLIHFGVADKDDMFDAHSYNKGGATLHMLRRHVGDEAFFTALKNYLTQNAFKPVEAHNLRLAMEEVSGEDLNWFFNQWYFSSGHPQLSIEYSYDATAKEAVMQVTQNQSEKGVPGVFVLPVAVDVYAEGRSTRHNIRVDQREQTFRFPSAVQPDLINFDAERFLLAEIEDNKSEEDLVFQFKNARKFMDRNEAIERLIGLESDQIPSILSAALNDPFYSIRSIALDNLPAELPADVLKKLRDLAQNDQHSEVRAKSLAALAESGDPQTLAVAKAAIEKEQALSVRASALGIIFEEDEAEGLALAEKLGENAKGPLLETIAGIFTENGDAKYLPFFEKRLKDVDGFTAISFFESYQILASRGDQATLDKTIETLTSFGASTNPSLWRRFGAVKALNDLRNDFRVKARGASGAEKTQFSATADRIAKIIDDLKSKETNAELKAVYDQLPVIK